MRMLVWPLLPQVAELKDKSKRRFAPHNTGVNGCLFITFPEGVQKLLLHAMHMHHT